MADTRKGQSNATPSQRDQQQQKSNTQSVQDLDIRKDDVERVKGGARNRLSSDPCEGGE